MNTVEGIPAQTIRTIAMVGNVVTYADQQWTVYAVEGYDYYAFQSGANRNETTCDFAMTPAEWKRNPTATIIPAGFTYGDGMNKEVYVEDLRRGVCLTK